MTVYHVFTFESGAESLWRVRAGYHPEECTGGRWLSDFGLGDFEADQAAAKLRFSTTSLVALPGEHKFDANQADIRQAQRESLLTRVAPPVRKGFFQKLYGLFVD